MVMSDFGSVKSLSEVLRLKHEYLCDSIDAGSLLSGALSEGIITEQQYADCRKETDAYKKAENFLGHLMRRVKGDPERFDKFLQLLRKNGENNIANHLVQGETGCALHECIHIACKPALM